MSIQAASRLISLAQLRLCSTDDASLDDARDFLVKAICEVEILKNERREGRTNGPEHISDVLARALAGVKRG